MPVACRRLVEKLRDRIDETALKNTAKFVRPPHRRLEVPEEFVVQRKVRPREPIRIRHEDARQGLGVGQNERDGSKCFRIGARGLGTDERTHQGIELGDDTTNVLRLAEGAEPWANDASAGVIQSVFHCEHGGVGIIADVK
jgi:hypothetical protein